MSRQVLRNFGLFIRQQRNQKLLYTSNQIKNLPNQHNSVNNIVHRNESSSTSRQHLDQETQRELQHHASFANHWWDVNGPLKALHSLNTIRVPFIRDGLMARGNISPDLVGTSNVLKDQDILEVGCGGGILTEQLARLGAKVTGIDLGEDVIQVAREHLSRDANPKLRERIEYKIVSLDVHVKDKINYYDAVVVSEVLEHVDDKVSLLTACVQCLKPGGSIFITTLNKTISMWVGGILLGEYVLRAIPIGTHHWDKLISPLDVQRILDTMGCHTVVVNGSSYDFWRNTWRWVNSTNMFYALQAVKTGV